MLNRLGPLVEPNFRRLWIGQTTSAVGDALSGVALVFAVLGISDSAADLGFVMAAFMVPRVLFLLVGGVWADRVPRRLLMVGSDVVRAVVQAGLAVAILTGSGELWVFIVGALLSGAASAFFGPAIIGLIPQTISPSRLQSGNALLNLSQSTAHMAGPIVAGILVAVAGAGWIFAIDAASFAISAVFLLRLVIPAAPRPSTSRSWATWPMGGERSSVAAGWSARWPPSPSATSPSPPSSCWGRWSSSATWAAPRRGAC